MIDINKPLFDGNTGFKRFDINTLTWDEIPKGHYNVTAVVIYPWRHFERDSDVSVRGDDGKLIWHEDGSGTVKETVKNLKWSMADVIYRVDGGEYDGYGIRGSLSTHPDFIGNTKGFVINAGLAEVPLTDMFKHAGNIKLSVHTYNKSVTRKDKDTGITTTSLEPNVRYTEPLIEDDNSTDLTGL